MGKIQGQNRLRSNIFRSVEPGSGHKGQNISKFLAMFYLQIGPFTAVWPKKLLVEKHLVESVEPGSGHKGKKFQHPRNMFFCKLGYLESFSKNDLPARISTEVEKECTFDQKRTNLYRTSRDYSKNLYFDRFSWIIHPLFVPILLFCNIVVPSFEKIL